MKEIIINNIKIGNNNPLVLISGPCKVCDQKNCVECTSKELLYNSKFDLKSRVQFTSTIHDNLQNKIHAQ